jgi:hypothetical protein
VFGATHTKNLVSDKMRIYPHNTILSALAGRAGFRTRLEEFSSNGVRFPSMIDVRYSLRHILPLFLEVPPR